jgi:hypothetical protein
LGDDQHLRTGLSNFVEMLPHLTEVRQTRDSVQVAEEHQQQRPGIIRKANLVAIGAHKPQVSHAITNLDCHG